MKEFEREIRSIEKNISYYSQYVSNNTSIYEYSDAKQEIMIKLWNSKRKYNKDLSALNTFYINVIKQQVLNMIKKDNTVKSKFIKSIRSIEEILDFKRYERLQVQMHSIRVVSIPDKREGYDFIKKIEINTIFDMVEKNLSGNAKDIFNLMRSGNCDLSYISKELKLSKGNICNIIRRKIRPLMEENFVKE